jgi:hypothetical protein
MARATKRDVWIKFYLDQSNRETFLNGKASAIAAGYKCKDPKTFETIGSQNARILKDEISQWLDEVGLSKSALRQKLLSLIDAKETKFFQKDGIVTEQIDVEALGIQLKALELAMKSKSMLVEKKEVTGKDGGPIEHVHSLTPELQEKLKQVYGE